MQKKKNQRSGPSSINFSVDKTEGGPELPHLHRLPPGILTELGTSNHHHNGDQSKDQLEVSRIGPLQPQTHQVTEPTQVPS